MCLNTSQTNGPELFNNAVVRDDLANHEIGPRPVWIIVGRHHNQVNATREVRSLCLVEWVKIRLTLPDPPPEALAQVNDAATLTAISALS